jgi:hypothetical protein
MNMVLPSDFLKGISALIAVPLAREPAYAAAMLKYVT